jgi:aminopeptidase
MRLQFCILSKRTFFVQQVFAFRRNLAKMAAARQGLLLGVYSSENENNSSNNKDKENPLSVDQLTNNAKKFNESTKGKLLELLNCAEPLKQGKCRILYGLDDEYKVVAVTGLGKKLAGVDNKEQYHVGREDVRSSVAVATLALRDLGVRKISVDPCGFADAAAEGAVLSLFSYDELKSQDARKPKVDLNLYTERDGDGQQEWNRGVIMAEGQNIVRRLMEMPANLLTPTRFAEIAEEYSKKCENFEVTPHDKEWAKQKKMFSFLSVNQGSAQPPVFLEMKLNCASKSDAPTVVLVGKGVCFDSGGISIKPSASMDKMRADMGGAANVFGTMYTLSRLNAKLPFNIVGLTPLVENMPGGKATRPGDIVFASNGKSIKIDNTDAEGRLILADALVYADTFQPTHVLDIATLTGAIGIALGGVASGVYCTEDALWNKLLQASIETGDRMWRMPLFKAYGRKMKTDTADLNNIAKPNSGAGSCVAAGFLKEFIECKSWAHLDIAGVMDADGDLTYIPKGMSGRPMRALVRCLEILQ